MKSPDKLKVTSTFSSRKCILPRHFKKSIHLLRFNKDFSIQFQSLLFFLLQRECWMLYRQWGSDFIFYPFAISYVNRMSNLLQNTQRVLHEIYHSGWREKKKVVLDNPFHCDSNIMMKTIQQLHFSIALSLFTQRGLFLLHSDFSFLLCLYFLYIRKYI